MKKSLISEKIAKSASNLIFKMAVRGANSVSVYGFCQPVEPEEMKKFKNKTK